MTASSETEKSRRYMLSLISKVGLFQQQKSTKQAQSLKRKKKHLKLRRALCKVSLIFKVKILKRDSLKILSSRLRIVSKTAARMERKRVHANSVSQPLSKMLRDW